MVFRNAGWSHCYFNNLVADQKPERPLHASLCPVDYFRIDSPDGHVVHFRLCAIGLSCGSRGHGLEVLQVLERQPFDIVFLDVHIPEWTALRLRV